VGIQASAAVSENARVFVAGGSLSTCHIWRSRRRGNDHSDVV